MTVADKLDEARALIEKGWHQGFFAVSAKGNNVSSASRAAARWCAMGALFRSTRKTTWETYEGAYDYLEQAIGIWGDKDTSVALWNDDPKRTQAEVIEAFRRAAELAREDAAA